MSAIIVTGPGGPESLQSGTVEVPAVRAGEVLIKVAAAGLNRADLLQRAGKYPPPKNASPLLGLEVSGVVVTGGARFAPGDQVVALCNGGGYAEFACVPEGQVLPLPRGYTLVEGAALPEVLFTVQQTLFDQAGLGAGKTALIHGGAGGVGAAALQMGALAGATMLTTVSSAGKADYARAMGAAHAIDYKTEDFPARVKELTGGRGAGIILDIIGGDYLNRNLDAVAEYGTIIQLSIQAGARAEITLAKLVGKSVTLTGTRLRPLPDAEKAAIATKLESWIWPALADGRIKKPMITAYDLADAAEAHRRMDSAAHQGKTLLVTDFGRTG